MQQQVLAIQVEGSVEIQIRIHFIVRVVDRVVDMPVVVRRQARVVPTGARNREGSVTD